MSIALYITELFQQQINLSVEHGKLKVDAPKGALTPGLKQQLASKKAELVEYLLSLQHSRQLPALVKADLHDGNLPMSSAQQRLWFLQQMEPDSAKYNVTALLALQGNVNLDLLKTAFISLVDEHEVLRTAYSAVKGQPQVRLKTTRQIATQLDIQRIDLSACNGDSSHGLYQRTLQQVIETPFDLASPPLFRLTELVLTPELSHLVLSFHHIIIDHWSLQLLSRLLLDKCQQPADAVCSQVSPDNDLQYTDYAHWQHQLLNSDYYLKLREYWHSTLGKDDYCLTLVTDSPKGDETSHAGARYDFHLPPGLFQQLQAFSKQHQLSVNTILLAAFQWLLARRSGMSLIRVACPMTERPHAALENMLGLFVNTVVVQSELEVGICGLDWLNRVNTNLRGARLHAAMPFEKLVDELSTGRNSKHEPLAQTMFNYLQSTPNEPIQLADMQMTQLPVPEFRAKFDLSLFAVNQGQALNLSFQYRTALFKQQTMAELSSQYLAALTFLLQQPEQSLAQHPSLIATELQQLKRWNQTETCYDAPATLAGALNRQASLCPDNTALVYKEHQWTYRALNLQVNKLANWLLSQGCQPEDTIAVAMERSPEMVLALHAIVKAGCAYLPLDPGHPQSRLDYIIQHACPTLILTQQALLDRFVQQDKPAFVVEMHDSPHRDASADEPDVRIHPAQLAYVLYTSGSTGTPKGVAIPHAGVINRILWMQAEYSLTAADTVLQKTPYSFDVSVWEFFWPLMTGATLVVAPPDTHKDSEQLIALIRQHGITTVHFVPAMLQLFLDNPKSGGCTSLRQIFCSGEALPYSLQQQCLDKLPAQLHNLYGPTEASIDVTYWDCRKQHIDNLVPIGHPIANINTWILDRELNPLPIGVPGELYLSGVGLARGYLQRPDLTAESFIPNPFSQAADGSDLRHSRLYRTGDLARYRDDGSIEYLGRADFQVKIRGLRIELGEIEAAIAKHPAVKENVVIARQDEGGPAYLASYIIYQPAVKQPSLNEWQQYLASGLPEYMVPVVFVSLPEMPVSHNGKIARKALPKPDLLQLNRTEYVAARTENEQILTAIWQQLLKLQHLGIHDNFFALGGDSITSLQVVALARDAGLTLEPKDIFRYQTIQTLAANARKSENQSFADDEIYGEAALSPIQQWYLNQNPSNPHHFNQALLLASDNKMDPVWLQQALNHLVATQPVLTACFRNNNGVWHQHIRKPIQAVCPLLTQNLNCTQSELQGHIDRLCADLQVSLDINKGEVFKACLVIQQDKANISYRLLLIAHHLVVDAVSWRIILQQLRASYLQQAQGKALGDAAVSATPFKLWTDNIAGFSITDPGVTDWQYWFNLDTTQQALATRLPADVEYDDKAVAAQGKLQFSLSQEQTAILRALVPVIKAKIDELCLAALVRALSDWCGTPHHLLNLEGHGRDLIELDVSQTVGWFTRLYPAVLSSTSQGWRHQLLHTRSQLAALPEQTAPFSLLPDALKQAVKPELVFNYLGQLDLSHDDFMYKAPEQLSAFRDAENALPWALEINCFIRDEQLHFNLQYAQRYFTPALIQTLATQIELHLTQMLAELKSDSLPAAIAADYPLARLNDSQVNRLITAQTADNIENIYPLTPIQQSMLFHCLDNPDSYISQSIVDCEGKLDPTLFSEAWQAVVQRHAALRSQILITGVDEPHQLVLQQVSLPLNQLNWQGLTDTAQDNALSELQRQEQQALNLEQAPLMRLALAQTGHERYCLVWTIHHLIMDGWCLNLLVSEVMQLYVALQQGSQSQLAPAAPYADFIAWLQQRDNTKAEAYWREYLTGFTQPTPLPAGSPIMPAIAAESQHIVNSHTLSTQDSRQLQSFCRQHALTTNTLIQGLWGLVLSYYTAQDDLVYGITTSGRPSDLAGADKMLGVFINTLPLRLQITDDEAIVDWLHAIQQRNVTMREFEQTPLAHIQKQTSIPGSENLFNTVLVFENLPASDRKPQHGVAMTLRHHQVKNNFPLTLRVVPGENLQFDLLLDLSEVDQELAGKMVQSLCQLSALVSQQPKLSLKQLRESFFADSSDQALLPAPHGSLIERLQSINGDRPALITALSGTKQTSVQIYSYSSLLQRVAMLAAQLPTQQTVIAICLPRQLEQIIAMLACWWRGAAWLCLDPEHPAERNNQLLQSAGVKTVLGLLPTEKSAALSGRWINIAPLLQQNVSIEPAATLSADALAYLMFTSGSTGQPKGVMVSHGNLLSYVDALFERLPIATDATMTTLATVAADLGLTCVFGALLSGRTLSLVPTDLHSDPVGLADYWRQYPVDVLKIAPSHLKALLMVENPADILPRHWLISGGETLNAELADQLYRLAPAMRLVNHYGPTETTIGCVADLVDKQNPRLGRPLRNSLARVMSETGRPLPAGVAGELWIAGHGVTAGYANLAEQTAQQFVQYPLDSQRYYKTGDRVIQHADGSLSYLGRIDDQVKIRGYRVELSEISKQLQLLPGVRDASTITVTGLTGERLAAAVVLSGDQQTTTLEQVKVQLANKLPEHMLPTLWQQLPALPINRNGKLDRQAMRSLFEQAETSITQLATSHTDTAIEQQLAQIWQSLIQVMPAPEQNLFSLGADSILCLQFIAKARSLGLRFTPQDLYKHPTVSALAHLARPGVTLNKVPSTTEDKLTSIWQQLLKKTIKPDDNFFALGGDSIIVLQMIAKAKSQGIALTPKMVFDAPSIRALSVQLAAKQKQSNTPLVSSGQINIIETAITEPDDAPYGLLPIQHWFFEVSQAQPHYWNQGLMLALDTRIEHQAMAEAVQDLVKKHPILTSRFIASEKQYQMQQLTHKGHGIYLAFDHQTDDSVTTLARHCHQSLDFDSGQVFKVVAFNLSNGSSQLLLLAHHLVVDGVSWRIIGHDLQLAYQSRRAGHVCQLGMPTTSMAQWQEALCNMDDAMLNRARDYWYPLANYPQAAELFAGLSNGTLAQSKKYEQHFSAELTQALLAQGNIAKRSGCEVMLLSALVQSLGECFHKSLLMIELEGHGRTPWLDNQDLSDSVGWFTARYPVLFDTAASDHHQLADALSEVPDHGLGYGVLRYLKQALTFAHPQVVFNYLGQTNSQSQWQLVKDGAGPQRHPDSIRRQLLEITAQIRDGQLQIIWQYPQLLHTTMQPAIQQFAHSLQQGLVARLKVNKSEQLVGKAQYPLTPMQENMYTHAIASHEAMYFNQTAVALSGDLHVDAFKAAWQQTVDAEQALRAGFVVDSSGRALQYFADVAVLPIQTLDWRDKDSGNQRQALEKWCQQDRLNGFNLAAAPLMRLCIIRITPDCHWLVWSRHHLIVDAWCSSQIIKDVLQRYLCLTGKISRQPVVRPQFGQYLQWLQTQPQAAAEHFWQQHLAGYDTPVHLPKGQKNGAFELKDYRLPELHTASLKQLARELGVTLNALIQAAWTLTLCHHSGQHDLVFGMTTSGRPAALAGSGDIIGLFINTLPVRSKLLPADTVATLVNALHLQAVALREHEQLPLQRIVELSEINNRQRLFDSLIVYENEALSESTELASHLAVTPLSGYERNSLPLTLTVMPHSSLLFRVAADTSEISACAVAEMMQTLQWLLTEIHKRPTSTPIADVLAARMPDPALAYKAIAYQPLAKLWSPHWRPEQQLLDITTQYPDKVAVSDGCESLSYNQLLGRISQAVDALTSLGINEHSKVAICQQRGITMLVTLLAVYFKGASYIPLDPLQPSSRLELILAQAKPDLVLTDPQSQSQLGSYPGKDIHSLPGHNNDRVKPLQPLPTLHPQALAYTIFTSGSTGIPKGVEVTRGAFANFLQSMLQHTKIQSCDTLLAVTTVGFDIAGLELFLPLLTGSALVIADKEACKDAKKLTDLILNHNISMMQATPVTWQMLADQQNDIIWPRLTVLTGGEALPANLAGYLVHRSARVINLYGPTETTVWSSCAEITPENSSTPHLGTPIANTHFYILDAWLNPVAAGCEGELYIGGEGLARGYAGQPALTADAFIPDPFAVPGNRMYRTGDAVRCNYLGEIEFIGRRDFQLKLRGYRIEVAEIEAALSIMPGVKDVAVSLCFAGTEQACLVAYVTAAHNSLPDISALKAGLTSQLPSYMVPGIIMLLDSMPLNANNKIDRKALPLPTPQTGAGRKPVSAMEQWLANCWQDLLNCREVFADDDFFTLGGNSLLAGRLIARLRQQKQLQVPLTLLFQHPVLADFAAAMSSQQPDADIVICLKQGKADISPLFVFHPLGGHVRAYNHFVAALPDSRPVYGIQSPQLANPDFVPDSIESLARQYVTAIQQVQPQGPYSLMGWSFGAWLAMAVTAQLEQQGDTVVWLGLIDARASLHNAKLALPDLPLTAPYLAVLDNAMRTMLIEQQHERLKKLENDLTHLTITARNELVFACFDELVRNQTLTINSAEGMQTLRFTQMQLLMQGHQLMHSHHFKPVAAPVYIWWAEDSLKGNAYQAGANPDEWQPYAQCQYQILSGNHDSIIRDPELAERICHSLQLVT